MKEELFDEIRRKSLQEIKNGRINLQKIVDKTMEKSCSFSFGMYGYSKDPGQEITPIFELLPSIASTAN